MRDTLGVPKEFFEILLYAQQLKFEKESDYKHLKSLLNKVIKRHYKIKKMADINILMNNFEDKKQTQSHQTQHHHHQKEFHY